MACVHPLKRLVSSLRPSTPVSVVPAQVRAFATAEQNASDTRITPRRPCARLHDIPSTETLTAGWAGVEQAQLAANEFPRVVNSKNTTNTLAGTRTVPSTTVRELLIGTIRYLSQNMRSGAISAKSGNARYILARQSVSR